MNDNFDPVIAGDDLWWYGNRVEELGTLLVQRNEAPLHLSEIPFLFRGIWQRISVEEMYQKLLQVRLEIGGSDGLSQAQVEMRDRLGITALPCAPAACLGWLFIRERHPEYLDLNTEEFAYKAFTLLKTGTEIGAWAKQSDLQVVDFYRPYIEFEEWGDWLARRLPYATMRGMNND